MHRIFTLFVDFKSIQLAELTLATDTLRANTKLMVVKKNSMGWTHLLEVSLKETHKQKGEMREKRGEANR